MTPYRFPELPSPAHVAEARAARVKTLTAEPGLFVEQAVGRSKLHAIESKSGEVVGYLAVLESTIIEFFLTPTHRTHADGVLEQAAAAIDLKHVWASTFDPLALAACVTQPRTYDVLGFHFRGFEMASLPAPDPRPTGRLATDRDVELVREANHPDVFDVPSEIPVWIDQGWVTLFELPEGLAGFGLCSPVGSHTRAADVGIRVCDAYQRRGLGPWIVQRMVARAREQGLVPIGGCAIDNVASRRTLERAGFVADHRLLQFAL